MLTYQVDVICDGSQCKERDASITSLGPMASVSMADVIAYAEAEGWQVIQGQGEPRFICPQCQRDHAENA